MKKVFSILVYTIYSVFVVGLILLFFAPPLPVIGHLDLKIVKSGSMEPSIMTGAVVVIREEPSYQLGDVITFSEANGKVPTTHRIIGTEEVNGKDYFVTKGDANEERDINPVYPQNVIGKVVFSAPYLGYVFDFARQPLGFSLLIGVPAVLLIIDELAKIWAEVKRIRKGRREDGGVREYDEAMPLVIRPYNPREFAEVGSDETLDMNVGVASTEGELTSQIGDGVQVKNSTRSFSPVANLNSGVSNAGSRRFSDIRVVRTALAEQIVNTASRGPACFARGANPAPRRHLDDRSTELNLATGSLIAILTIGLIGQFGIGESISYLHNQEKTTSNRLMAQTFSFDADQALVTHTFYPSASRAFGAGVLISTADEYQADIRYDLASSYLTGNLALCAATQLNFALPEWYSAGLLELTMTGVPFPDLWDLTFSVDNSFDLSTPTNCSAEIILKGYLVNADGERVGFVTERRIVVEMIVVGEESDNNSDDNQNNNGDENENTGDNGGSDDENTGNGEDNTGDTENENSDNTGNEDGVGEEGGEGNENSDADENQDQNGSDDADSDGDGAENEDSTGDDTNGENTGDDNTDGEDSDETDCGCGQGGHRIDDLKNGIEMPTMPTMSTTPTTPTTPTSPSLPTRPSLPRMP